MQVSYTVSERRVLQDVIIPEQVHGDTMVLIQSGEEDVTHCDALITENPRFKLGVYTADCAAVCFSDGVRIGVAHCGWRGLCLGILEKMILEFDVEGLEVQVSPHMFSFEIQKDACYELIVKKFGTQFLVETDGRIEFQFRDAVASCLPAHAIFDERNTYTDTTLPSHRRDKTTQRLITAVSF